MTRTAIYKHATQVDTSTYPDDGTSPVGSNEWNEAPNPVGMLGFTAQTIASASSITPTSTVIVLSGSTNVSTIAVTETNEYDLLYVFTSGSVTLVNTSSPATSGDIKLLANANTALSTTIPIILIRKGTYWYEYGGAPVTDNSITSAKIADGAIMNVDINASAAIATSKISGLATSATTDTTDASNITTGTLPLARLVNITNTEISSSAAIATSKISGLATSATTDTTNASNISSGTLPLARLVNITNTEISSSAAISLSKLASDPLARANHTGTQAQSTIVDLVSDLALKAPLASPTFTGTVAIPNYANVETTLGGIATNASAITLKANIASPTFTGTVTIPDLIVNGTTTTINSTTLTVDDLNIELGSVATPSDSTANGGGITLKGATDKTIIWDSVNSNWTSSEHLNVASGKSIKINNVELKDVVETLANKTITAPVIATIVNTGTVTFPTATDTLVGKATTDTLTNKTINLTSNTLASTLAQLNTAVSDADVASLAGTETLTNKTISLTSNTLTATSLELQTAISDETGSGALVFGTSPTITTPVISGDITTASGNLTINPASNKVEIEGNGSTVKGALLLNCEYNTHGQTIVPQDHSANVTNTLTLPAGGNQELVGTAATQTLTAKTLTTPTMSTPTITGTPITAPSVTTTQLDFGSDQLQTISISANTTFTTTGLASGKSKTIKITTDGTLRNLTFPAWIFVGKKPTDQAASKISILTITSFGTTDADCVAAFAVEA